jgi:hypothetical protein
MSKLISWVVLGVFVVLVPLGSWYYLHQGLKYRKNALQQLQVKDSFDLSDSSNYFLKGKTSLIVLRNPEGNIKDHLEKIESQYGESYSFQICTIDAYTGRVSLDEDFVNELTAKFAGKDYVLIDTSGKVRNVYTDTPEDLPLLVEHLAIILPRPVEPDIKMKQ